MSDKKEIDEIKKAIVANTDECFHVSFDSDGAGNHYTIYLVRGGVDMGKLQSELINLKLSKRYIVILCNDDLIKYKIKD